MLTDELGTYEEREMALRIIESAAAIEGMLADLQRYSFSLTPVLRELDARRVAEGVLLGLGEQGAGVRLVVEDEGEVAADPVLLQQALLILLHNALDAAREAGEDAESVRLTIRRVASGAVCFDVWNAGSLGEHGPRVFDPFFTTKSQNLGIGLSIARRIAVAHEGHLGLAADAAGRTPGITFTLLLPGVTNRYG
jgi:C4-dicarboxylate-specific signal transduction histidine kinase